MEKLDSNLLEKYINGFYGYGKWNSKYWFIGIEEGGGEEFSYVERKLNSWVSLKKKDLVDKDEMHRLCIDDYDEAKHHSPTWNKLILAKCGIDSESYEEGFHRQIISCYKAKKWGQTTSENSLIELFPLPSPTMNKWKYDKWTEIDYLKNRDLYEKKIVEKRKIYIKNKIIDHEPKLVLFYGTKMTAHWNDIIGVSNFNAKTIEKREFSYVKKDKTLFVKTHQPSYIRGYSFWKELGKELKTILG